MVDVITDIRSLVMMTACAMMVDIWRKSNQDLLIYKTCRLNITIAGNITGRSTALEAGYFVYKQLIAKSDQMNRPLILKQERLKGGT